MFGCAVLFTICFSIAHGSPVSVVGPADESIRRNKSGEILKYMGTTEDPCEDFYEFVCGNFAKFNPASRDVIQTGMLTTLQKAMSHKLQTMLLTDEATDTETDQKVKLFYRSCMNLPAMTRTYSDKLKEIADEFGQMPALVVGDTWQEEHFDWLKTVGSIAHKLGIAILIDFSVGTDFADNTTNRLYIMQQEFPLKDRSIYLDKKHEFLVDQYKFNIARKLKKFLHLEDYLARQTAAEILDFESALAQGALDAQSTVQMSDIYKDRTLDEVQEEFSAAMNIKQQVSRALGSIPSNLKVYVQQDYLRNLPMVVSEAPKKIVANYIFYSLLDYFIFNVPETEEQLSEKCLEKMNPYFSKSLDNMVYRKYNSKADEAAIGDMWQNIKAAFRKSLQSSEDLNWIREDTRKYAVEKLNAMSIEIMSYESYNFTQHFGQMTLDGENYIGNVREILAAKASQTRALIDEPPQQPKGDSGERMSMTPANDLLENSVKIPVAFLQPQHTWSASLPNSFNYGVLGAMLSHELLHGFDGHGRTYDTRGNNRVWWDSETSAQLDNRSKCLRDQYREYVFGGRHLPEMTNQSENIADNGGVRLAYQAYLNWYDEQALTSHRKMVELESLPGLNYTNKQLFFISYGQLWCSDSYAILKNLIVSVDRHVPGNFRVIGPLSNFDEFSKEFKCPEGSGMNPTKKCKIY